MSGPLPVRHIQTGNSQRGLQRDPPRTSAALRLCRHPVSWGCLQSHTPSLRKAELAGQETDGEEAARGQREGQQGLDQSRAR